MGIMSADLKGIMLTRRVSTPCAFSVYSHDLREGPAFQENWPREGETSPVEVGSYGDDLFVDEGIRRVFSGLCIAFISTFSRNYHRDWVRSDVCDVNIVARL